MFKFTARKNLCESWVSFLASFSVFYEYSSSTSMLSFNRVITLRSPPAIQRTKSYLVLIEKLSEENFAQMYVCKKYAENQFLRVSLGLLGEGLLAE